MSKNVLIPLEDHILVEAIEEENKTRSGILLPDSKEKPSKGIVVSVGSGKILDNGTRAPMDVQPGEVVYFTKYAPEELEIEENGQKKKYLIIKQSSLLAKQG